MQAGYESQQKMNDYKYIRRDPSYSRLSWIDTNFIHNESIKWLGESLSKSKTKKNVVITHHAPDIKSIVPKCQNDLISAAYASDLEAFINKYKPDFWIHGHIHKSADYFIGDTRVICNPRGYPDENVEGFDSNLIVEINS